jgi:hypothetical protein
MSIMFHGMNRLPEGAGPRGRFQKGTGMPAGAENNKLTVG